LLTQRKQLLIAWSILYGALKPVSRISTRFAINWVSLNLLCRTKTGRTDKKLRDLKRKTGIFLFMNGEILMQSMTDFYDDGTWQAAANYYRNDIEAFGNQCG
jgi:hypothetical protein